MIDNAATAASVASGLMDRGVEITQKNIEEGLSKTRIEGRLEVLQGKGSERPDEPTIVVDGAHNHESAFALAQAIRNLFSRNNCIIILGVNQDKNINAIWRELAPISRCLIATRSSNLRAVEPEAIAQGLEVQVKGECLTTPNVGEAIEKALSMAGSEDVICVTGSLYLVAEAREYILNKQKA